jgi:GT2 family glycosyltransferase
MSDHTPSSALTWSLVIATYQRPEMLATCISMALAQTRPPTEVVVVDGSDSWKSNRTLIQGLTEPAGVPLDYEPAVFRSSSAQRNQGIDRARGDVLFLIDDDALMTPTCAEHVMRVYETDLRNKVVAVGADDANAEDLDLLPVNKSDVPPPAKKLNVVFDWFKREVFLMNSGAQWVPYDGTFPKHDLPADVRSLDVETVNLLSGYQMTFRRTVLENERFEPLVRQYATFEYQDLMNRVQRHGAMVVAHRARLHHAEAPGGRSHRRVVSATQTINQAWYVRQHSADLIRDRRKVMRLAKRRVVADFLKDVLKRRIDLPHARGAWFGYRHVAPIFDAPIDDARQYYMNMQSELAAFNDGSKAT